MADFTYAANTVLSESTGEFAVGATGVLRETADGPPVSIYDLNDSPLQVISVGSRGVHQAFKADIPDGILDFGSALLSVVSAESHRAGLRAITVAEAAVESAQDSLAAAQAAAQDAEDAAEAAQQAASVVVATPRFVLHGADADFPRPDEDVLPVIWVGSVKPNDADTEKDQWLIPVPLGEG